VERVVSLVETPKKWHILRAGEKMRTRIVEFFPKTDRFGLTIFIRRLSV
jgi:hypothetical protein